MQEWAEELPMHEASFGKRSRLQHVSIVAYRDRYLNILFICSKDCNGQSVLHYAVQDGHTKCLKLLLEYGVSIDEQVHGHSSRTYS